MGFGGYVVCNCYKEGKTTEPPHKSYLHIDEYGLSLEIPHEIRQQDSERAERMEHEFNEWKEAACEHEDMDYANENLANRTGMSMFRSLIGSLGSQHYPVLSTCLPANNEGFVPTDLVEKLLEELSRLESEPSLEQNVKLIETSSGHIIGSVRYGVSWPFQITRDGLVLILNQDGFFILEESAEHDRTKKLVHFQSKSFLQEITSEGKFRFIDLESKSSFESPTGLYSPDELQTDSLTFEVSIDLATLATSYGYIIQPLKILAKASVQTGNPICWM